MRLSKIMNKKGAELAIGTIVMIILALVVLVVIIYGFTIGWGNLWENIVGYGGGQVNVQTVVQACQVACSTQSVYDYCTKFRNVVFQEKSKTEKLNCHSLQQRNVGLDFCDNIDCVSEKGVCSGTIDPKICNDQSNRGKLNCESVSGCLWETASDPTDLNKGNCNVIPSITCSSFNDNRASCVAFGCQFN